MDYANSLGLKAGTDTEAGDNTCGFYYDNETENGKGVGLYGYDEQDLVMYLEEFGFDFIKVDWCGGLRMGLDEKERYTKIGGIIDEIRKRTGRCMLFSGLCGEADFEQDRRNTKKAMNKALLIFRIQRFIPEPQSFSRIKIK